MSTTETVRAWATSNAGNAAADAAITSSDAQSPDTVDNNIRSVMAAVKKQMNDIGGSLVAGGSANALTVTTGQVLESGQITDGLRILVKATADNTSATVTFAPDGLTAANVKRADGSPLAVGSIKSGMYLDLVYNSGSSEWRCANIAPIGVAGGLVYLTSGSASGANLDIVLTSYTAYRGFKIFLSGFLPASDGVDLLARFSTDGGSSYYAVSYRTNILTFSDGFVVRADTGVIIAYDSGFSVGNASTEGVNAEITLLNQTSSAFYSRLAFQSVWMSSAITPSPIFNSGGGAALIAQDSDAIRFLFRSGNISAGNYALYGLV